MFDFEKSIKTATDKVLSDVNLKCYQISGELFTSVVQKTPSPSNPGPTAKGLLANQWYPISGAGTASGEGTSISPTGSSSLSRIQSMMSGTEFNGKDGRLSLANNLNYATQAESEGWVNTAPYRMVALSLQAIAAKFKKAKI